MDIRGEKYEIPRQLITRFGLESGVRLKCEVTDHEVSRIYQICGRHPEAFALRETLKSQLPVSPYKRYDFGASKYKALRIIDLFMPIGKGTRGLIVSPPRAGKTSLLIKLANEFTEMDPRLRVIALLIDERPEEVTAFMRSTSAQVFHSSLDQGAESHIALSNFLINHIKAEVESKNHVVVLIDSLTRMGRAYNRSDRNPRSRTMSGGLSSGALELPRKLFGMARAIQDGGSCTILATILTNTGSRMDEMIFQEFKGTGNCEIVLDRSIAEERVFPAINLRESGTRRDELLIPMEQLDRINLLRRSLLKLNGVSQIEQLKQKMVRYPTNEILLKNL